MRRRLNEQKVDVDIAIAKCLERARLAPEEAHALNDLGLVDLTSEHNLDYILADKVRKHVDSEVLRMQAQDKYSRIDDSDFDLTSLTRLSPIPQKPSGLTETRLRYVIRKVLRKKSKERPQRR
jgi:hypothetical protein